jgi:hypothetical protein
LIEHAIFPGESITHTYTLWKGAALNGSFNVSYNIYDQDGVTLSDTLNLSGNAGDTFLTVSFISDTEIGLLVTCPARSRAPACPASSSRGGGLLAWWRRRRQRA